MPLQLLSPEPTVTTDVSTSPVTTSAAPAIKRFIVKDARRWRVVPTQEVDWIESAGNYIILHCGRDRHIVRSTMLSVEDRVRTQGFVRISRSTLVNLDRVQSIESQGRGRYEVILRDQTRLPGTVGVREILASLEIA